MATPTRVATIEIRLDDDTTERYTDVGYYVHREGLDLVDQNGEYVRRFGREEYLAYTSTRPAAMTAA